MPGLRADQSDLGPSAPRGAACLAALAAAIAAIAWHLATLGETSAPELRRFLLACWLGGGALWLGLGAIAWHLRNRAHDTPSGRRWFSGLAIVGVAVGARAAIILTTSPTLSDDLWRYVHDGATLGVDGVNPYRLSPAEAAVRAPLNNPELVTIYQPASQWVFAGLARLSRTVAGVPPPLTATAAHRLFRAGFAAFDLAVLLLLMGQLAREGRSPWWSVLWGWHPLVLGEVAASGHQDVLGIACLLLALNRLEEPERAEPGHGPWRAVSAGVALALAVAVKPVAAPLCMPLAWSLRRRPRRLAAAAIGLAVALAALYGPFVLMEGGLAGMWRTAWRFVEAWAFNSSIHGALLAATGSKLATALVLGTALAAVLTACAWRRLDHWRTAGAYFLTALLLSSTAHPWYLLWALAFVPLRFDLATWVLSLTIGWSYVAMLQPQRVVPAGVLLAEYGPVYALLAARLWPRRRLR